MSGFCSAHQDYDPDCPICVVGPPDAVMAVLSTVKICQVHHTHRPEPHALDAHHIQPRAKGGPTTPENLVVTCPTGHRNVHALLALYQHHGGPPPYHVLKRYAAGERHYAVLGWQRMQQAGLVTEVANALDEAHSAGRRMAERLPELQQQRAGDLATMQRQVGDDS